MKGKSVNVIILVVFFTILKFLLSNSNEVVITVLQSMDIFIHKLFPILFPFFVLSSLMMEYGVVDFLGELMKNITSKRFKMNQKIAFPLLFSTISGFPSGAKYTSMLYQDGEITKKEANQLLGFTHFANPAFIFGTVGSVFLNNKTLALLIFLSHLLGGILTGMWITRRNTVHTKRAHVSLKKAIDKMEEKRKTNKNPFGKVLAKSISNTLENLFSILGTITFFMIMAKFVITLLPLPQYGAIIFKGILEMTQGIEAISSTSCSFLLKGLAITFFLSFGGISVHMQVVSMISNTDLSYANYLKARIIHVMIACFLFLLFFYLFI